MFINELNLDLDILLRKFIEQESELLIVNASEQAITNRLARLIEQNIANWHVDCEYNRDMYSIKKLKYALSEHGDIADRSVVPDIIVHHRLTNENLLAIEIKKDTNPENRFKDHAKLTAFIQQLGYQYTLFVDFHIDRVNPGIKDIAFVAA